MSRVNSTRLVPIALVSIGSIANASPTWRLDLSARGIGSVELDSSATMTRGGLVPAMSVRAERRAGPLHIGGTLGAGFPAWYGKTDAALSLDYEAALADRTCTMIPNDDIGEQRCTGARWLIDAGVDAGIGLLYFDAPPETPSSGNALVYWGPLARARVQLHVLDVLPSTRAVGLVVGANAAVTSARYMSPGSGTGLRLEPELEVGLTMRL